MSRLLHAPRLSVTEDGTIRFACNCGAEQDLGESMDLTAVEVAMHRHIVDVLGPDHFTGTLVYSFDHSEGD